MTFSYCPTDEIGFYLEQAELALNEIIHIDSFSEIFEAGDPEIKEKIENNEKAKEKGQGFIAKAAKALADLFRRIKESIEDFFIKRKLTKDQREAYDAFKEACKKDPSLKNKKITVKDYRKICEQYDEILKEVEAVDKELAAGKDTDTSILQKKITDFTSSVGKAGVATLGLEAILNTCSVNQGWARTGYNVLRSRGKVYNALVEQIGEKRAKKTEKELKILSKRISLRKLWLKCTGRVYKDVYSATAGALRSVKDVATSGASLGTQIYTATSQDIETKSTEGVVKHAARKVTNPIKAAKIALSSDNRKDTWKILKNKRMIDNFRSNQTIDSSIKSILSTKKGIEKAARQYARGKIWDARARKWITGPIDEFLAQYNSALNMLSPSESEWMMAFVPANMQPDIKDKIKMYKKGKSGVDAIFGNLGL